jgi:hypothetical protein
VEECVELYLHTSNTPSWRGAHLRQRDSLTFHIYVKLKAITSTFPIVAKTVMVKTKQIFNTEFVNIFKRRIFGPKREEAAGSWRRLHNEELHDL